MGIVFSLIVLLLWSDILFNNLKNFRMKKLVKPVVSETTNDAYALCNLGPCEPLETSCYLGACNPLKASNDQEAEDEILF